MKSIIEKAAEIMSVAHSNQLRKTDKSPYIIHPRKVALILQEHNFSDNAIAAALVHDVLEDTDFSEDKLKEELGEEVHTIVKALTEDMSLEWEERKEKFVTAVENGSEDTKAVAIADKIHNLEDLLVGHSKMGSKIWKKFNRGKDKKLWFEKKLLKMFKNTWQHPLISEYENLIKQIEKLD